ncbi:DUF3243 family protein [Clostridium sp. D53t1_180928_C8]|uniref:DUF3243 family protein n=1 Tax=Clostridium sp. D53t1_180928_C8 TaxID=2787101 RepID=UPI0018ABCFEB|nr:DUF3243 family protein [Clostridium sp. D53t1_180928_C8]
MNNTNFDTLKEAVNKELNANSKLGVLHNTITESVGYFLSNNIQTSNNEENLLKELWNVANSHDKHVLAKLVVKITQNDSLY